MSYTSIVLHRVIEIQELFSVHYFEYSSDYSFPGESHDFWELVYVDSGTIQVTADSQSYSLSRGQMIFHAPQEFHALSANGVVAPNLIVIGFQCHSPAMDFFHHRITFAGAAERTLLARIVEESAAAFSSPLNDPLTRSIIRREHTLPGSDQLIALALEELLIRLLRQVDSLPTAEDIPSPQGNHTLASIIDYLEKRLDQPLTVDQICRDNMIGRSQLQKLFHQQTGGGALEYFNRLKMNAARQMIREGRLNFTQIAATLGFQSVHYFSRRFRAMTGMSPSEYADSVKMIAEASRLLSDNRANNV